FSGAETFPARLDSLLEDPIDDAGGWMRANRLTHPLFTSFFTPISDAVGWVISSITDLLLWLPWYVVIASAAVFPARKRRWLDTAVVVAALGYCGAIGLWVPSMQTLALMSASVLLAVIIGVPLGIWGAVNPT